MLGGRFTLLPPFAEGPNALFGWLFFVFLIYATVTFAYYAVVLAWTEPKFALLTYPPTLFLMIMICVGLLGVPPIYLF